MGKKVAIVISTKNRSEFIIELLRYYARIESQHTIYIGDASDPYHINKIIPTIKSLGDKINIVHKQYPEYGRSITDLGTTLNKILEFVEEEYVVGSGDDDYFIPQSLDKCVEFLEYNPDYSSAHGHGTFIRYNEAKEKTIIGGKYNISAYQGDSASERFKMFITRSSVLFFSVHRTRIFRKTYKNVEKLPLHPTLFVEIMPGSMSAILGNSKELDILYLIRGVHESRYKQPELVDTIIESGWSNALEIFINTLSEELRILDGIDEMESKAIVKQGFSDYIELWIKKVYSKKEVTLPENIASPNNISRRMLNRVKQSVPSHLKKFIRNNILPISQEPISQDNNIKKLDGYYDVSGHLSKGLPYYNELSLLILIWDKLFNNKNNELQMRQ